MSCLLKLLSFLLVFIACGVAYADGESVGGEQSFDLQKWLYMIADSAVQKDFQYQQLKKDVEAAKSRVIRARMNWTPSLDFFSSIDDDDNFTSNSLSLSLNLFNGFQDIFALRATNSELFEIETVAKIRKRQVEFDAGRALFRWIDLALRLQVQKQDLKLRKNSLEIMEKRFARGLVAEDEVLKMKVDWMGSQVDLLGLEQQAIDEELNFRNLFGVEIKEAKRGEFPSEIQFYSISGKSDEIFESLKEVAQKKSPLIVSEVASKKSKSLRLSQARAKLFSPSLDATYTFFNSPQSLRAYSYENRGLLSLSMPLFSQFEDKVSEIAARVQKEQAELEYLKVERDVFLAIEKNISNLFSLKKSVAVQIEAVKLAQKFYRQSVERFRLGVGNSNDMAFDLQRLSGAKTRLSRLKRDFYNTLIETNLNSGHKVVQLNSFLGEFGSKRPSSQ